MKQEKILRGMAGFFVLLSIALARFVNPAWIYFTIFVGLNLLQSAFSGWCPMISILNAVGIKGCDKQMENESAK